MVHNKVRFERLTGVSADVVVLESRGSIGSDPFRGRLRTLGHVAKALLEVAPRVPGAFRGKTIKTAFQLKAFFSSLLTGFFIAAISTVVPKVTHRVQRHT